jgi:hypothetical protein
MMKKRGKTDVCHRLKMSFPSLYSCPDRGLYSNDVSRGVSICQNVTEMEDKGGGWGLRARPIVSKQIYYISDIAVLYSLM